MGICELRVVSLRNNYIVRILSRMILLDVLPLQPGGSDVCLWRHVTEVGEPLVYIRRSTGPENLGTPEEFKTVARGQLVLRSRDHDRYTSKQNSIQTLKKIDSS